MSFWDVFILRSVSEEQVDTFLHFDKADELAMYLAEEYLEYLKRQIQDSVDWLHRYLCNYLLVVRKYMAFLQAEQQGDALAMEAKVVEFLPIFYATNKSNSFNSQVRLMELYYHRLPISILQQIRLNRTKQQKPSTKAGSLRKESAIDQIMERLMPFFKAMSHSGTEASFVKVSRMLTACQRAKHFVEFYTRNRADGEYELSERFKEISGIVGEEDLVDPGQRNKSTVVPKSRLNRVLIMEVLILAKCHEVRWEKVVPMDNNHFWRALDRTELEVHKKLRRTGDGKVTTDVTDQFVVVQVQAMMPSPTEGKKKRVREEGEPNEKKKNDEEDNDDESTVIDLEEAMKDNMSMGDESVFNDMQAFSDDEMEVVEIEAKEDAVGHVNAKTVVLEDDEHMVVEEEKDNAVLGEEDNCDEVNVSQLNETQLEDLGVVYDDDDRDGNPVMDEEGKEDVDDEGSEDNTVDDAEEKGGNEDGTEDDNQEIEEGQNDRKVQGSRGKGTEEKETVEKETLREKSNMKGMKAVEMNPLAATDIYAHALEQMEEKNVISGKHWDSMRKEREHHFLRYRLFTRLEAMEEKGSCLQWSEATEESKSVTTKLDRSLNLLKSYKCTVNKES